MSELIDEPTCIRKDFDGPEHRHFKKIQHEHPMKPATKRSYSENDTIARTNKTQTANALCFAQLSEPSKISHYYRVIDITRRLKQADQTSPGILTAAA
jgi:hypothetical protein